MFEIFKSLIILIALIKCIQMAPSSIKYKPKSKPTIKEFGKWVKLYGKNYGSHSMEYMKKYETFLENHKIVESLNKLYFGKTEFILNGFADLSPAEFKQKILMKPFKGPFKTSNDKYLTQNTNIKLPDSFDWRDHGAVTEIKDQGTVGTCWAFSTVQNIEGQFALKGNPLTNLSVEQIVDCDSTQDNSTIESDCGVYGGWPFLAFQYIQAAGGIVAEKDYPYCAGNGGCEPCEAPGYNKEKCGPPIPFCYLKDSCQAKLNSSAFVKNLKVIDWKRVGENETEIAANLLRVGPLSVALNAELLQFYHKGVFDPIFCDPSNLDHAVLMVGWGVETHHLEKGKPYWIIKNSWGIKWGEDGYFRILRDKGKCGINTQVTTSILL